MEDIVLDAGDAALALDLVFERDGAATERWELDGPRDEAALVHRASGDLRDLFAGGLVVLVEEVGVGRRELDVDLLDLGDRDALGDRDFALVGAEVGEPNGDLDRLRVPA